MQAFCAIGDADTEKRQERRQWSGSEQLWRLRGDKRQVGKERRIKRNREEKEKKNLSIQEMHHSRHPPTRPTSRVETTIGCQATPPARAGIATPATPRAQTSSQAWSSRSAAVGRSSALRAKQAVRKAAHSGLAHGGRSGGACALPIRNSAYQNGLVAQHRRNGRGKEVG